MESDTETDNDTSHEMCDQSEVFVPSDAQVTAVLANLAPAACSLSSSSSPSSSGTGERH